MSEPHRPGAPAPRRVLVLAERYPELSQTFVDGEVRELRRAGWDVEIAALAAGAAAPIAEEPAAPVRYPGDTGPVARLAAAASVGRRRPRAVGRYLMDEAAWPPPGGRRRLRGLARVAPWVPPAGRADHLHAHFAAEAADVARLLAGWSDRPWSFAAHATEAFVRPAALRRNLAAARFCVTDCEYNRRHMAAVAPEHAAKIEVLILGADLERFRRETPYAPDGPVLAIGRLVPKKGFDDLVLATVDPSIGLGDREVLIVGDGPGRPVLEALVARTGAPVRLLGARPHRELRALLETASMFVLPCVVAPDGDRDSMPVAIKEAMALELPVIGTDEVGIPELITTGSGRLVPPRDPPALAAAIGELLALAPSERVAMGRAGRAWVAAHCDRRRQAERLMALIAGAVPHP